MSEAVRVTHPERGGDASDRPNLMNLPLRRTPLRFRWWLAGCLVVLLVGFALLHAFAPGPDLSSIVTEPGALMLLALILLADLYPILPWMRRSHPFDEFYFSTPLAIAALMAFGPHAALVFVIAGLSMSLALRMRWWRVLLNTALWGVQGAVAAGVLAFGWHWFGWPEQMPVAAMLPMTVVLAVVIEGLNVILVFTSQWLAGATTPRAYLADWRDQLSVGALDLTAPIPAVLAATQPALLPLLALAMVAAQVGLSVVTSRTALADTDPLTSLPNRAFLLARLKSRLGGDRESLTVLMIDLDRFKRINDDLGHLAGDQVLVEVARRLEESTRSSDVVARFGGDEFAVLLTGETGRRSVREVVARIRTAVGRPIQVADRTVLVGVTVGWAVADRRDVDPLGLIKRADDRLYAAKAARPPDPAAPAHASWSNPVGGAASDPAGASWAPPLWTVAPGRTAPAHDGGATTAIAP